MEFRAALRPFQCAAVRVFLALALLCSHVASLADDPGWQAYQRGDFETAAKLYEEAAKHGERLAEFNFAMTLFRGEAPGSKSSALKWLRKAAEQGLPQAQYNLGLLYENGEGLPRSQADATTWFRLAAGQGHTDAQVSLATQYFLGRGAPKDYAEAARWYEAAAEGGDVGAQYIIASMYEHGDGVAEDLRQAVFWYAHAARQGDALAQEKAREVAKRLGPVHNK